MSDLTARLAADERAGPHPYLRPRDAATLIVVDRTRPEPRLLMGRRHERHAFMPGKFVFPGGRVDPGDARVPVATDLHSTIVKQLVRELRSAARARALAVAAVRETYEEAGLLIGQPGATPVRSADWEAFAKHGLLPALAGFRYVARAITPPGRPRRFDTRFFLVDAREIAASLPDGVGPSGELDGLAWTTFNETLALDLPLITRTIVEEVRQAVEASAVLEPGGPVPFYAMRSKRFVRALIGSEPA